eukprot:187923-Pyramimonas_sp.AAC.1
MLTVLVRVDIASLVAFGGPRYHKGFVGVAVPSVTCFSQAALLFAGHSRGRVVVGNHIGGCGAYDGVSSELSSSWSSLYISRVHDACFQIRI